MFFNTKIRTPNKDELEVAYRKLSDMYQELYEEKQSEIDLKDKEIKTLSSKTRQWMRRYHQLEVSTREDSVDVSDIDNKDQDYIQQLQNIVAEMSKKNHRLEKRIAEHKESLSRGNASAKTSKKCEVVGISQPSAKKVSSKAVKEKPKTVAPEESKEVELKFSAKFQAVLEKHAQECSS